MVSWKQRENIIAENMVNVRKRNGLGVNFFAMFNSVSALHFCAQIHLNLSSLWTQRKSRFHHLRTNTAYQYTTL